MKEYTQEELAAYRSQEYQDLRGIMANTMENQKEWSIYALGSVISALGVSFALANPFPELCLVPLIILLIAAEKVHNLQICVERLAAYLIVKHEHRDGAYWESGLLALRQKGSLYVNPKTDKRSFWMRLSEAVVAQEFALMALVCIASYAISAYEAMYATDAVNWTMVVVRIVLLVVGVFVCGYIYTQTRHYNRPRSSAVDANIRRWKAVFQEAESQGENQSGSSPDSITPP